MKTYVIREIGEVKEPNPGEWYLDGNTPKFCGYEQIYGNYPILSLEVFDYDPIRPIEEIWKKYKYLANIINAINASTRKNPADEIILDLLQAICHAMEGK